MKKEQLLSASVDMCFDQRNFTDATCNWKKGIVRLLRRNSVIDEAYLTVID